MKRIYSIYISILLSLSLLMGAQLASAQIVLDVHGWSIPGVGDWDGQTGTLTDNVINQTIEIKSDDITLDGAGYTITGSGSGSGVRLYRKTGVTIKNVTITNFAHGIYLYLYCDNNILTDNTIIANKNTGIYLIGSSNNTLTDNTIIANIGTGLLISGNYNEVYNNNFISNSPLQAGVAEGSLGNVFNHLDPGIGGNHWNDHISPDDDPKDDIVDLPYILYTNNVEVGQDEFPWTTENGWDGNSPPLAVDDSATTDEDTSVTVAVLANDSDVDGDSLTVASVTVPSNGAAVINADDTVTYDPNGQFEYLAVGKTAIDTFSYTVSDGNGGTDIATVTMTISGVNDAPEITSVTGPEVPVAVGAVVTMSVEFTDPDIDAPSDVHKVTCEWGDGTADAVIDPATSPATSYHTYNNADVCTVKFTVEDDIAASDSYEFQYVIVYDPEGGFVTGDGWIDSPAGAYPDDLSLTGEASFVFSFKYKKGATVPNGQAEFQFGLADLNFQSTEYEWLVIDGDWAKYKGSGTINGADDFGFILSVVDGKLNGGGADKLWIKIWNKSDDEVVYDNQSESNAYEDPATQAIADGSIVIHRDKPGKGPKNGKLAAPSRSPEVTALPLAFPTPANPEVWIPYQLGADNPVVIRIYSMSGRLVRTLDLGYRPVGFYASRSKAAYWNGSNEAGERVASGIYFYSFQAGDFTATRKLIISK